MSLSVCVCDRPDSKLRVFGGRSQFVETQPCVPATGDVLMTLHHVLFNDCMAVASIVGDTTGKLSVPVEEQLSHDRSRRHVPMFASITWHGDRQSQAVHLLRSMLQTWPYLHEALCFFLVRDVSLQVR